MDHGPCEIYIWPLALIRGIRHPLVQRLFADEETQPELSLIAIAVEDGIELLTAESAHNLPLVVGIEHAFESLA